MFLVPVPYRKSLSWNTLRARKRAEAKDASLVGVRGQENGLLRKPKETTPPLPLASPATRAKGKVSKSRPMAHAGDVICVCGNPSPARCPSWFLCFFLTRVCVHACVCAQTYKHTHSSCCVSLWLQRWFSTCIRHEVRLNRQCCVQYILYLTIR